MIHNHLIGYACLNMDTLQGTYKTCRISDATEAKLLDLIEHNLKVLKSHLEYNIHHGNAMFRISSSLIPFASHPANTVDWVRVFSKELEALRTLIKDNKIRISCHPGQYTVINSPSEAVVSASIDELYYHATMMEVLSGNPNHKIILHVGGVYEDKAAAMARFIAVYHRLDPLIKKYLTIENDDRSYTVEDILYIASKTGIPCIYDNLHHACNPSLQALSAETIFQKIVATWSPNDGIPKMHYSQQDPGKRLGAHTPTIDGKQFLRDLEAFYDLGHCDIMLEVKDKNRSFMKVHTILSKSKRLREEEWARYKYLVMAHSQAHYNALRAFFKGNDEAGSVEMYTIIDEALLMEPTQRSFVNAADHVWGYFKKICTETEKKSYLSKREKLINHELSQKAMKSYLLRLAIKYEVNYLLDSYFLKP